MSPADLDAELRQLREENVRLKEQLERITGRKRSPEDFSAAVHRALDKLQGQLSTMTNAVTNFAVREFRLETNVHIQVTEIGDLEYRFVGFDERPDPATLSRITLDLAPIPKQSAAGTFQSELFTPDRPIGEIDGLSVRYQNKLHEHQIDTVGDLMTLATRARAKVELAALLKIDRQKLAGWITSAALLTLRGVDRPRAAVLSAAGFRGLDDVAAETPESLVSRFKEALAKAPDTSAKPIESAEAATLIKAAQAYLGNCPEGQLL